MNVPKILTWKTLSKSEKQNIIIRGSNSRQLQDVVSEIIKEVKNKGDLALQQYANQWDRLNGLPLKVTPEEMEQAWQRIPKELQQAMQEAKTNIEKFHKAQNPKSISVETTPGLICYQQPKAIERVGLYVPGGTAPLFSTALMLALPAKIAGCQERVMMSPGRSDVILAAAFLCEITEFYACGGAQAIAALTYGTESMAPVSKIFGPGNSYVTEAKIQASQKVAIDMPAGPSEVLVIADQTANPNYVLWDLLSQMEHDCEAQSVLVSTDYNLLNNTMEQVKSQIVDLPRRDILEESFSNSLWFYVDSIDEAMEMSNQYAPEHLILHSDQSEELSQKVSNAGSVFIGSYTPESFGDYASGTNHVLPTAGAARSHSGVSLLSFFKFITFQKASYEAMQALSQTVITMAEHEQLYCHAQAVRVRK